MLIMLLLCIIRGIYPYGDKIYVRMDFYHQYAPFVKEFARRVLNGDSLLYAWEYGLGTNYWAHYAYYLASPLNWLLVLVPGELVVEAMNLMLIFRAGVAGSAFVYFLKDKRKEDMTMAVFGIFYALSGYYLAYSCNVIWMDSYALFPLIALGVLRIAKGKSAKLYVISMLICTFSNFYLAVIVGMCCVLWLSICLIGGRKKSVKAVFKAIGKFVLSTLLYVGMCAIILLPVLYALINTPAGESKFPEYTNFYFGLHELFGQMCLNIPSNLNKSELPNIYASVFVLVLLPMYFANKSIRLKDKIIYGIVCIFMLLSFSINSLDYIWHGLHFPNSFPARQSFFYIFLVLVMGYEAFMKRKRVSIKVLYIAVPILAVLTGVAWIFLGKEAEYYGIHIYLCTLLFILLYGVLLVLERKINKKVIFIILLVACCAEMCVNVCVVGIDSVVTRRSFLEDDHETQELLAQIRPAEGEFYRIEEQDRHGVNDAGWDGYYGASYFSSTIPGGMMQWYDAFGMRNSTVSYSYDGATPLVTSLLNIRYVFASEDEYYPGNTFKESQLVVDGEVIHLYENTTVLPLGYMVEYGLEDSFGYNASDPFLTINSYAQGVLDYQTYLFTQVEQYEDNSLLDLDLGAGAEAEMEDDDVNKPKIALEIPAGENVFLYVTTHIESVSVEMHNKENGQIERRFFKDLKFKKILPMGVKDYDRTIVVCSADDDVDEIDFYSYRMNEDVLRRIYEVLNSQPFEIQSFEDTNVTGNVNVKEDGVLFMTIPYDKGWTVYVDGVEAQPFAWKDAFLGIELTKGTHTLEFTYCPVGFKEGAIISFVSTVVALVLLGCSLYKKKRYKK